MIFYQMLEDVNRDYLQKMAAGYGDKFSFEELSKIKANRQDIAELRAPIPALGRYAKSVKFLEEVTSGFAVSKKRFAVLQEYFFFLFETLRDYEGEYRSIFTRVKDLPKSKIRKIGMTYSEIKQAEYLERFTDHDTAAAGDYLKFRIASEFPFLTPQVEGIHFSCTSEDVMGNVFGLLTNELVFDHFFPALQDLVFSMVKKIDEEHARELIIPALTHEQAAEPTLFGKFFLTRIAAIRYLARKLYADDGQALPFSGKMGGAVGNLTTHYAAYPDIDWWQFAQDFVEKKLGLHYEPFTDQCASYVVEAHHFGIIAQILTQLAKLIKDFVNLASCPSQFFVKEKKKGQKGSSLMPNKSNAWSMEGAIACLKEARSKLIFLGTALQEYPHEGNMERSYLFRNVGEAFMPIFIAFDRIKKEFKTYKPNPQKISAFFREYPGVSGSSLQTVLKRIGVSEDAYRAIQEIAINPDGSYANYDQFFNGLVKKINRLHLKGHIDELFDLLKMDHLTTPIREKMNKEWEETIQIIPEAA